MNRCPKIVDAIDHRLYFVICITLTGNIWVRVQLIIARDDAQLTKPLTCYLFVKSTLQNEIIRVIFNYNAKLCYLL